MDTSTNSSKLNILFLDLNRWMAILCAFGIPWSNASFNIGFYSMLIFFTLSLAFLDRWQQVLKTPVVIIVLSLFAMISLETIYSNSRMDLANFDFIHYRKLLAIPLLVAIFTTNEHKKQLLFGYCLGVAVLMLPTLLDGFGIVHFFNFNITSYRNAAYSASQNGVPNLVYWRNQIVHGFHVSILFSACLIGAFHYKKYRYILLIISGLCLIDIVFFIYGRMALLSLLTSIITMIIIYSPTKKHIALILTFIVLASSATYFIVPTIQTRLNSIINEESAYKKDNNISTSGGIRLHYWAKSWQLFKQSPIIGNGSGSFRQSMIINNDPLASLGHRHTHNEYLTQLSQYGVIGFLLLTSIILISLRNAIKIADPWLSNLLITGIIVFALNALTDSSLHNDWEGWAFVLFVSMASFNINLINPAPNKKTP